MNFMLFLPEFLLAGLAFGVLGIDLFLPRERKIYLPWITLVGLVGVLVVSLTYMWGRDTDLYDGLFLIDNFSLFFKGFFLVLGALVVLVSVDYVKKHLSHPGEYYGILLFSILGMMLMTAAGELLTAYISLELLSFSLYVLVSFGRNNPKSNEAGIKYILLGAFASALLLYGISQVYGMLGTTRFSEIQAVLAFEPSPLNPALLVGLALIVAGLGFKVAAVPFHMWAPDVYEGAPTPITAYLAVGSKAAAFALILRLFSQAFLPAIDDWQIILVVLAALTMTVGNLVALAQDNIKRMLAYSSIGHVGYLLLGVAALSPLASDGVIFHLAGYGVTNLAAFLCVIIFYNATNREDIAGFAGLADRAPYSGDGPHRGPVLAGGAAVLRRLHNQVLPVHRRRRGRAAVAGGASDRQQPDIPLLLPDGHKADVHGARRGERAGEGVPGERRSPGAAGAGDHRPGRLSRPSCGRDTRRHGRDTAVAIPGLCWQ